MKSLKAFAMKLQETEEGIACEGTAVESATYKVNKKAYLFLRAQDLRLKLQASLPEAEKYVAKEPERYSVGAGGWIKVILQPGGPFPKGLLERWTRESYELMAAKPAKKPAKPSKTKKG